MSFDPLMSCTDEVPLLHTSYSESDPDPNPGRFVNEHCATLTYTGSLNAITWRNYLIDNWDEFKRGLSTVKVLIICGVHGGRDGSIGGDANNFTTCNNQTVNLA